MLNAAMAWGALIGSALLTGACSGPPTRPTANTTPPPPVSSTPPPTTPPPAPFVPSFPAVSQPARVYVAERFPYIAYPHGSLLGSRFVLFDDGNFGLQYSSLTNPFFQYTGTYTEQSGDLMLAFHANNGRWTATAAITDGALSVKFNLDMQMSDFEDGVYLLNTNR